MKNSRFELWTDISVNQNCKPGNSTIYPINFAKMRAQGIDGVVIRKSFGTLRDPAFSANWLAAFAAGLKRSFYSVYYPQIDFERQVEAMTTFADRSPFNPAPADRPPWADLEVSHGLPLSTAIKNTLAWLYRMKLWAGSVDIYTGQYRWNRYYSDKAGWCDDWRLVIASYGHGLPLLPTGWQFHKDGTPTMRADVWDGWQYSADGNGLGSLLGCHSRDVDLSWRRIRLPEHQPLPIDGQLAEYDNLREAR